MEAQKIKEELSKVITNELDDNLISYCNNIIKINLLEENDEFIIDFDEAYRWLGYTEKRNAKRTLTNKKFGLEENRDYKSELIYNGEKGTPSEKIILTIDCFNMLAMVSGTEIGKKTRKYFVEVEKIYRKTLKETISNLQNPIHQLNKYNFLFLHKTTLEKINNFY